MRGWEAFSRRTEANYAEHHLIEGKPKLQKIGDNLDAIRFDIQLHSSFSNVERDIEALRAACVNGEVLPLIDGKGLSYGSFVIVAIDEMQQQTFDDGTVMLANLSVELREYEVSPEASFGGFAAVAARVIPIRRFQSEAAVLMDSAVQTTANASTAGSHIENAKKGIAGAVEKGQRALKKVREGLTNTQRLLDQAKLIITAKDRIENDINRTQQAVQNATEALAEGDIDGAIVANRELQNGVSAMNGGLAEVAVITAIRK